MSASRLSITANTAARRRPVVVTDNNIELATAEINGGGGDDRITAGAGKDLSHHSIRGEAVLERSSKDLVKKSLTPSTVSPRRSRKAVPKSEKPQWQTILSVFAKNFVLLIVVVGLVQLLRRLVLKPDADTVVETPLAFSDLERRIAEVDGFVKTTAKMIQVQVEVVDRKIVNEVGGLRREFAKKIDDKALILEGEMRKLEAKNEELENSVSELRSVDWLSKEEFEKIYTDLKNAKSSGFGDSEIKLDDIRAYARELVEKEIEKHAADGLGRVDYALASGGGMVVRHSEPYLAGKGGNWFVMHSRNAVTGEADKMLKPSFGEPGQCFPLKGSSGFVQIRLRTAIIPDAITLEHADKSVAYDRSSAPKDCRVSGWLQGHGVDLAVDTEKMFLLAEFTYDLEKSNAQTFNVLDSPGSGIVDTVRFDFSSNHGSPSHTCIYRLRVHGHEPDSASMLAMQS